MEARMAQGGGPPPGFYMGPPPGAMGPPPGAYGGPAQPRATKRLPTTPEKKPPAQRFVVVTIRCYLLDYDPEKPDTKEKPKDEA